jgi:hypothetical protein
MRVLSLLQPWASLVILGLKKIETRSWPAPESAKAGYTDAPLPYEARP